MSSSVRLLLAATFGSSANAQVDAYNLTGTIDWGYTYGDGGYTDLTGNSVTGQVALDRGDTPDGGLYNYNDSYAVGQSGGWTNDGFSINLDVSGLGSFGSDSTEAGGTTYYWNTDFSYYHYYGAYQGTGVQSYNWDGNRYSYTAVYSYSFGISDDGLAEVADPWDPLADQYRYGYHYSYDYSTGVGTYFTFTLDSFDLAPTTIIIDGCDTGVDDFEHNGSLASAQINACADSAKNHGQFVSCVAKLTNTWKKAGLITDLEKTAIMECAAQSSVGK